MDIARIKKAVHRRYQRLWTGSRYIRSAKPLRIAQHPMLAIFFDYEGKWAQPDQVDNSLIGIQHILDVLEKTNLKCTFNIVGHLIYEHQRIIHRIIRGGHEIASHTVSHTTVSDCSCNQMVHEVNAYRRIALRINLHIAGFRGPESRYTRTSLQGLCEAGLLWNAECDAARYPYVICKVGKHRLWRMPVTVDDWPIEEFAIPPERMLCRWMASVEKAVQNRDFVAVGFHPWVMAKNEGGFLAFDKFLKYVERIPDLTIEPFGSYARECEGKIADKDYQAE